MDQVWPNLELTSSLMSCTTLSLRSSTAAMIELAVPNTPNMFPSQSLYSLSPLLGVILFHFMAHSLPFFWSLLKYPLIRDVFPDSEYTKKRKTLLPLDTLLSLHSLLSPMALMITWHNYLLPPFKCKFHQSKYIISFDYWCTSIIQNIISFIYHISSPLRLTFIYILTSLNWRYIFFPLLSGPYNSGLYFNWHLRFSEIQYWQRIFSMKKSIYGIFRNVELRLLSKRLLNYNVMYNLIYWSGRFIWFILK